jgi:hypothetical protein
MKNIKFVVATKETKKSFLEKKPFGLFLEKTNLLNSTYVIENNTEPLTKIYNKFLTEEFKNNWIIFIHDDVLIDDLFALEKIQLAFEKYDIIGLAGTKSCNINSEMCAWHLMSESSNYVGEVAHYAKDRKVWTTVFGPSDSRALLLDGLFIGVNVEKAIETGLKWDENFSFHHYDISFCLRANNLKIKAGVFPLRAVHYGLGDSMLTEDWKKSNEKFKTLYATS